MIRTIPGLEHAEMARCGYGVEYDHIDARELGRAFVQIALASLFDSKISPHLASLETNRIKGLFLAGQINGECGDCPIPPRR